MTSKNSMERIRDGQNALASGDPASIKAYRDFLQVYIQQSDILLFGCIDARLPIARLGAGHGAETIPRYPGAFVTDNEKSVKSAVEIGIKLKKVTDIVVMGHTDCGAAHVCLHQNQEMPDTLDYLKSLKNPRDGIVKKHGLNDQAARRMEEEIVRKSLINLMQIPNVAEAVKKGKVRLHGWVLDLDHALATPPQPFLNELQLPKALTPEAISTAEFKPMAEAKKARAIGG